MPLGERLHRGPQSCQRSCRRGQHYSKKKVRDVSHALGREASACSLALLPRLRLARFHIHSTNRHILCSPRSPPNRQQHRPRAFLPWPQAGTRRCGQHAPQVSARPRQRNPEGPHSAIKSRSRAINNPPFGGRSRPGFGDTSTAQLRHSFNMCTNHRNRAQCLRYPLIQCHAPPPSTCPHCSTTSWFISPHPFLPTPPGPASTCPSRRHTSGSGGWRRETILLGAAATAVLLARARADVLPTTLPTSTTYIAFSVQDYTGTIPTQVHVPT